MSSIEESQKKEIERLYTLNRDLTLLCLLGLLVNILLLFIVLWIIYGVTNG